MGRATPTPQATPDRDQPPDPGSHQGPCPATTPQGEASLKPDLGTALVLTIRHFFPDFNRWLDDIADPRDPRFIVYQQRFLLWWGLGLFLFKLGSRRKLDFDFSADETHVLDNFNRLAETEQQTRPVHDTLDYYLTRLGPEPLFTLRVRMARQLIRNRVLDPARLQGYLVTPVDGTGLFVFHEPHCPHCLTRKCGATTLYMHQALEAKVLGPGGVVVSLGTSFIDNRDLQGIPEDASDEKRKQDCELKALRRLACRLREDYPQTKLCLLGDGLYACGEGFQIARDFGMRYVYTFKEGRVPSVWKDVQGLLQLCPENRVQRQCPDGTKQEYRWVNDVDYTDSDGREWQFNVITCEEELANGVVRRWAWVTDLEVNKSTVVEVATGGRSRWKIENEGFNTQKNSGLNLEHVYSYKAWEAFYLLLQMAHTLLQLLEKGSLLRQLARHRGKSRPVEYFGSLELLSKRLLESLRLEYWPDVAFGSVAAQRLRISLDSS